MTPGGRRGERKKIIDVFCDVFVLLIFCFEILFLLIAFMFFVLII